METVACNLCGADRYHIAFCQRDLAYGTSDQKFSVVQCQDCQLLYLNPRPTASEIGKYYPEEYFPVLNQNALHRKLHSKSLPVKIKQWLLEDYYGYPSEGNRRIWKKIRKVLLFPEWAQRIIRGKDLLPYIGTGRLLDVGCGPGVNLGRFQNLGWDVYGVELSEVAVAHARRWFGDRIHAGKLENSGFEEGSFDVILFSHSLEHMFNPVETLVYARGLLKSGGIVVITVPNAGSLEARLFGQWWVHWDFPRHLYHFDNDSLVGVLRKAGFSVTRLRTGKGSYFFMVSLHRYALHVWHRTVPSEKILERLIVRPLTLVVGHLGYGSEITAYAVRS